MRRDELKYSIETILNDIEETNTNAIIQGMAQEIQGLKKKDTKINLMKSLHHMETLLR